MEVIFFCPCCGKRIHDKSEGQMQELITNESEDELARMCCLVCNNCYPLDENYLIEQGKRFVAHESRSK